jgi:amino acid adenylation domain-containing protein
MMKQDQLNQCIHQLFETQVTHTPDAVAVCFEDKRLTYTELNSRANRLASYLQTLGIGPEVCVALCMERSLEMVVGLLGIVKAGGAYVPVDPGYPLERQAFMLTHSQARVVLTQRRLLEKLPRHDAVTVCLDTDELSIAQASVEGAPASVEAKNLVCVLYTSGSTGKPKGVMFQHQSLACYIKTACQKFGLNPDDRVLQFASISFDGATEEIWLTLLSGAQLVLRTSEMLDSLPAFLRACQEWRISVLDLPTAYWHAITAELNNGNAVVSASLRLVIVAGERVSPEYLKGWQRYVGSHVRLVNAYGPTEATIVATICDIASFPSEGSDVPIGQPISNVQVYLLDSHLQPVPVGTPGELYIGGRGVTRGYFNAPELTAERFLPDPFIAEPGARLYRSGDLARYLPNGTLEFLGRADHQIKLRGFRIEPGEVEAVLAQHSDVREALVMAREDIPEQKRLVAYVVPHHAQTALHEELRSFAQERLPEYMVPSLFVMLERFPLTPNGKIDRGALPVPTTRSGLAESFVAPRTSIEQLLAQMWSELLQIDQISVYDNLFALGVHSLLMAQVVSRIRMVFHVELSISVLLKRPSIAEIAEIIEVTKVANAPMNVPAITQVVRERYGVMIPLSQVHDREKLS